MFLTDNKLEARTQQLKGYRYREVMHLGDFLVSEDRQGTVNPEVPADYDGWDSMQVNDTWQGRDRYLWLHKDITIPEEWKGKKVLGIFDYGNTGAGNNSGFESLLYVDKTPYQGVDVNHKEVFFEEEHLGRSLDLTFRLWSGLEGGGAPVPQEHRINQADLAWLDEKTDDLYYLSSMIIDAVKNLHDDDPVKHQLRTALDSALECIDWSYPGSSSFYESVHLADEKINEKIESMGKDARILVKCVGHTHIDVAWLWRLKHTREKCSRSFSTVLRLMEQYPEYVFLQTQPQLYEYIKNDFPQIFEKIKEKVKSGQWEVDGGMWVEADCNITSGESLTRQILIGSKFIKDEFDKEVEYLWLPDVFGYSWALPQILKKSGIDMFMTTKISWNQYNRMPHDTFKWKGIDGSEILTHFITTPDPWSTPGSWFYTYNGQLTAKTVKGVWDAYSEKDMNKELLISYGYGDGGGGVNRDMLEQRRRIDKIPGLPALKTSTAGAYFRDLKDTVKNTDQYVHTWDGELYLEYHRGTYTSQGYNKRMNRKMEYLYGNTEWLTAMAALSQGDLKKANQEALTEGWKILLTNQFHDIIPGSSIHEVYEDSKVDYEKARDIAREVEKEAYGIILDESEDTYTVLNHASWKLDGIIEIPETGILRCMDQSGNNLKMQTGTEGTYVQTGEIPAMGFAQIRCVKESGGADNSGLENDSFYIEGKSIETKYYIIDFNDHGQISRLYDKDAKREVLAEGTKGNVLQMFEDKPLGNDAWDIDIFYQQKMKEITDLQKFQIVVSGPLMTVVHLEWKYMNSTVEQDIILYEDNRRIDFRTKVDYHENHQLLKAAFPVDIRTTYATYDVQYGNVKRPNHWNTSWDQARFETVAHRFADLSEHDYGVALLNDCKYGYDVKDNILRITLLKAATHPDHLQDQGLHEFTYALLPHRGDCINGRVIQEAHRLNRPLELRKGTAKLPYESFLVFDCDHVEADAIKKSEDGNYLVVRFHEFAGSRCQAAIKPGFQFTAWAEGDLRERPIQDFCSETEISMMLKPFEIKTILFKC